MGSYEPGSSYWRIGLSLDMIYEAEVISGKGRGKGLGFPTLNLAIPKNFSEKEGIYACKVTFDSQSYLGALHFGPVPVFGQIEQSLEIFVLDWNGKNEPQSVSFEMKMYLREIRNFDNPKLMTEQIAKDVSMIRAIC